MVTGIFVVTAALRKQLEIGKEILQRIKEQLRRIEDRVEFSNLITDATSCQAEVDRLRTRVNGGVVVVCTGGTDHMIKTVGATLHKPVLFFAHPLYNALASTREALAVLRWQGIDVRMIYGDIGQLRTKVEPFVMALYAAEKLQGSRIGIIGEPEPWLLTIRDWQLIEKKLGIKMIGIAWNELLEEARKANKAEVSRKIQEVKERFGRISEPTDQDLDKAIRLYIAMKELIKRYSLHAMAVEARDMIDPSLIDWGPYLGVSLISDEGIPADYEVEHDGIITKLIIHLLTGKPSFMANITKVEESKNTTVLSHCTVPTSMIDTRASVIRSYYETNKSVAIRGRLRDGAVVTIARIGGKEMDQMMIASGKIVNGDVGSEELCRTQIEVKIEGRAWGIVEKTLGNHVVVVYGNVGPHLLAFCKVKGIQAISV